MNQLRFEKFSKTKMAELNNLKIQFFTNIAHEFKTPLTLIISPLNKIMKAEWNDETTRNSLELVQRNAIRLQDLINQLMTFRALENNKVTIKNSYGDLVVFLNDLATLFKPLAKENSINFFIDYNPENYPCFFDHDKLEKIFYNLFSNAVKYTPNGGQINFQFEIKNKGNNALVSSIENMSEKFGYLEAKVINSGYQIPQEQVVSIFENTYQSGWADSTTQNSSGMGLTFTKELIKLLMGEITVKSNQAETCFKVSIPILASNELLNNHTMIRHQNPYYRFDYSQELLKFQYPKKLNNKTRDLDNKLPKVLIVEDNVDLQHFLNDLFCNDYHLIFASDGFEGLKLAEETNPVLVISDIMMPNMSGYELCKNIKMDIKTSHIPVILLSALNEKENKITGMEAGADVYIEKPFDPEYLILQVKNLIDSREVIRQAFSERIELEPDKATITSTDNIFIKRAIKSVENHMSHVEYNVDQLVSDMGLSRTLLYKKIKSLTNLSANEFIINIRMKRAAQLLRDSKLTVSEIAIEVGYREPSYFSTCFKKFFHVSPSKYHKHTFKGDMASSLGSRKSGIAQSPKI